MLCLLRSSRNSIGRQWLLLEIHLELRHELLERVLLVHIRGVSTAVIGVMALHAVRLLHVVDALLVDVLLV